MSRKEKRWLKRNERPKKGRDKFGNSAFVGQEIALG